VLNPASGTELPESTIFGDGGIQGASYADQIFPNADAASSHVYGSGFTIPAYSVICNKGFNQFSTICQDAAIARYREAG